ncbi:TetR/AcrR family transcriptional regulator [Alloalcanivorax mobilis]|mgnify:CR=1 FL=1|uniref:TetR/AcrR family transcriptional regulator n=1 Tax=Alloalcanivorax mobilis TaxID=2019569 RepID=UPI0012FFD7D7|nr:TetR family transcriptional regulator [Alloalcanivorax mobilis]
MSAARNPRAPRRSENETRDRLIDTAERLWADEGLGSVSLNRIRKEAGEKNASVINYHFGSEEGLLLAVLRRHWDAIIADRRARLATINRGDGVAAVQGLAEAMVLPFAATLTTPEKPSCYVQLMAQWYRSPAWRNAKSLSGWNDNAVRETELVAIDILPELPAWVVVQRMRFLIGMGINVLADWESAERLAQKPAGHLPRQVVITMLIDSHINLLGGACAAWLKEEETP